MNMSVAVSMNGKYYRRKGIRQLDEPTYVKDIIEPLQRYDEKNTPLSRGYVPPGGWDEDFLKTLVPNIGSQGPIPRDESGYTQIDIAQRIAGFHTAMAANCHTGNYTRPRLTEKLGCFFDVEGPWSPGNIGLPWKPERLKVDDPAEMSEIVKDTALFLGASLVGITELNRDWVYKPGWDRYGHKEIDMDEIVTPDFKYAIVIAIETSYDFIKHAPTAKASAAAGLGYSKMAMVAPSVAKFVAALGYKAIACGNDTTLSVPLAVDAGLGQLGRNGIVITPEFGPRVRLCKVLTDLPLKPTKPIDFGVTQYCDACKKCAEYCPAQAISYDERTHKARTKSTNPGLLKWPLNGERCLRFWYRNGAKTDKGAYHVDCYQCINVCPFSRKPGLSRSLATWFISNMPAVDKPLISIDQKINKPMYTTGIHKKSDKQVSYDR
jgi:reductive dehalogenase